MNLLGFALRQLAALAVALMLLAAGDRLYGQLFPAQEPKVTTLEVWGNHFQGWSTGGSAQLFRESLAAHRLVVFGSSELTSSSEFVPYRLFANRLGRPVFAFGAGGAQSLTILVNLLQHEALLGPETRLVIVLSPWWFLNPGTDVHAFRQFTQSSAVGEIYFNRGIAPEFKEPLERFLREKMHQINPPSLEMILFRLPFLQNPLGESFVQWAARDLPALIRRESRYYEHLRPPGFELHLNPKAAEAFNWSAELAHWRADYVAHSSSNSLGFVDSSWPHYKGTVPRSLQAPHRKGSELADLRVLVDFLKAKKVPALFIQQPLNALAYTQMERFEALKTDIAQLMKGAGMDYEDFLSQPYQKEELMDLAHFSDYGWLRADEAIQKWLERMP